MRILSKPEWIQRQEMDFQNENDRRIELQIGSPQRYETEYIIRIMKKRYSKYAKQRGGDK